MNELPDPQDETDRPGKEPADAPEVEYYTPERVRESLAEDALPPGLRARAAAQSKRKLHRN